MSRTADYTIQGFIYQFIVTLQQLLLSDDNSEILVEGLIEDIDIRTPSGIEATQCKYHEAKEKYTLSAIYKPILQMMCHYQKFPDSNIQYRLYAHFPNKKAGSRIKLKKADIIKVLSNKDRDLQKYKSELANFTNIESFIEQFDMEFGASLDELQKNVIDLLLKEGFGNKDVEEIFYPNAIHTIAELSIKHDFAERKVRKPQFISVLKNKKKTAINRWTKELQSYNKLLQKRREQMREYLNQNSRVRALILDSNYINHFDSKIVQLIVDFVHKYNYKSRLHYCPVFSLICDEKTIDDIWTRLHDKKITVERGLIAREFNVDSFLREPIKTKSKSEFQVRLCSYNSDFEKVLSKTKFDDLFIISDKEFNFSTTLMDTNIERIETKEINEIKYLLSMERNL